MTDCPELLSKIKFNILLKSTRLNPLLAIPIELQQTVDKIVIPCAHGETLKLKFVNNTTSILS